MSMYDDPKSYELVVHFRSTDGTVHQSFIFPNVRDISTEVRPIIEDMMMGDSTQVIMPNDFGKKVTFDFEAHKGGDRKNQSIEYFIYDWTREGMSPEAMGAYMSLNKLLMPFDRQHLYEVAKAHIRNEDQERKHLINDFGEEVLIELLREKGYVIDKEPQEEPEDGEEPEFGSTDV